MMFGPKIGWEDVGFLGVAKNFLSKVSGTKKLWKCVASVLEIGMLKTP